MMVVALDFELKLLDQYSPLKRAIKFKKDIVRFVPSIASKVKWKKLANGY